MPGLIFDIRSFSVHDGPGIRQTIFFKGCPLSCSWCHNPESRRNNTETHSLTRTLSGKCFRETKSIGQWVTAQEIMIHVVQDIPFFEESGGGVTLSGGEPLAQSDFAARVLELCKENHVHTAIDTSGYANWKEIEKVLPFTDLFLYDLKLADDSLHTKYTGVSNKIIHKNLAGISSSGKRIHIRIPLIQEVTDTTENLEQIKTILSETKGIERIDLLPYHHIAKGKYERMNLSYDHVGLGEYPLQKTLQIKEFFSTAAPLVSIGG
jgi:pyruvate formate lyase activating enzyme